MTGSGGRLLKDYFNSKGGPTAYLGTTVPGFPNFFMMMGEPNVYSLPDNNQTTHHYPCLPTTGPNTATGHASVIYSEEVQINYAIQLIKPVLARKARSFTVQEGATDRYNAWLEKRIGGSVFTACASYYRSSQGGKNVAIFPGPLALFWWFCRTVRWSDYRAVGAEKWEKERRRTKVLSVLAALLLVVGVAGLAQPQVRTLVGSVLKTVLSKVNSCVLVPVQDRRN